MRGVKRKRKKESERGREKRVRRRNRKEASEPNTASRRAIKGKPPSANVIRIIIKGVQRTVL